jgi:hypothetical protein
LGDCPTRAAGRPGCRFDRSEVASAVPPVEDGHAWRNKKTGAVARPGFGIILSDIVL